MANKTNGNYAISVFKFEEHKLPAFEEKKGTDYISYGKDNNYPYYLLELTGRSSTHNALLTGKAQYVTGEGFEPIAGMERFMANKGDDMNKVLAKAVLDREIFNGFSLQIDFGVVGGKIVRVSHIDFSNCRLDKSELNVLYCDWSDRNVVKNKEWKVLSIWGAEPNQPKRGSYVIYYAGYRPNMKHYPLPDYVGAIPAIETDVEIANYHLNNIKNGFTAGTMINFNNGVPPDEKKNEVERKIKGKFQGTDRAGGVVINFSDSPDKKPDILTLSPNDLDKQFEQLRKDTVQEIFVGHKVTSPVLFGVATPGALGQRNEMLDAYELFTNTYVAHAQGIFEQVFTDIAAINGYTAKLKIKRMKPVQVQLSEATLTKIMTDDELRASIGLGPRPQAAQPAVPQQPVQMSAQLQPQHVKILHLLDNQPLLDDAQIAIIMGIAIEQEKPIISDLVQSGMLDSTMTPGGDQVRLLTEIGKAQVKLYPVAFSKEELNDEKVFALFESFAIPSSRFFLMKSKFYALDKLDIAVLEVLKGNKGATDADIAKALKIDEADATKIVSNLVDEGIIKQDVINDTTVERTITPEGKAAITESDIPVRTIETYYAYDKNPEVSGRTIIPTTREFCKKMVELTDTSKIEFKLFDRKSIDKLSALLGYDVWAMRGGWYTRKGTDEATPYCRHIWKQTRVIKK